MESLLQTVQPLLATAFTLWGSPVSWAEVIASVCGLAMVGFNMRVNPIAWPLAIVSSLLYLLVFWNSKLYGEGSLQIVFIVLAAWGWWQWLRGRGDSGAELRVRPIGPLGRTLSLLALALGWPAIAWILIHYSDSTVPWWDAFPTAASLIGQWLLGRKHLENWPVWVVVNVVSVALFAYKGLWLVTLLYVVFVGLSFAGWRSWSRLAAARV
ncbi:MAG: hypothetical protein RLZZ618_1492 [Pseudomonadota bacterium]|jgi:nicotinamide mononucleotide transporter